MSESARGVVECGHGGMDGCRGRCRCRTASLRMVACVPTASGKQDEKVEKGRVELLIILQEERRVG